MIVRSAMIRKVRFVEIVDYGTTPTFNKPAASSGIDWICFIIVLLTSIAAASLPSLPFRQHSHRANSFVVSTMLAFTSASSAVLLNGKPKAARVFRNSAIACLSTAILLLADAIFN